MVRTQLHTQYAAGLSQFPTGQTASEHSQDGFGGDWVYPGLQSSIQHHVCRPMH